MDDMIYDTIRFIRYDSLIGQEFIMQYLLYRMMGEQAQQQQQKQSFGRGTYATQAAAVTVCTYGDDDDDNDDNQYGDGDARRYNEWFDGGQQKLQPQHQEQ